MRVVLDTSVAVNIVLQTQAAAGLIAELEQAQLVLAPTLLHSKIANTLRKQVRFGQLGHDDAIGLYHDGIVLVDEFVPDHELAIQALSWPSSTRTLRMTCYLYPWPALWMHAAFG